MTKHVGVGNGSCTIQDFTLWFSVLNGQNITPRKKQCNYCLSCWQKKVYFISYTTCFLNYWRTADIKQFWYHIYPVWGGPIEGAVRTKRDRKSLSLKQTVVDFLHQADFLLQSFSKWHWSFFHFPHPRSSWFSLTSSLNLNERSHVLRIVIFLLLLIRLITI